MLEHNSSTLDEIMVEVYRAIYSALESRLHLIGSVIDADSRKEILTQQIYDKGDFYGNTGYVVETDDSGMTLRAGSNVKHEPFAITLNPLQAKSSGNPICPPSPVIAFLGSHRTAKVMGRAERALVDG
jgi:hypothetical protein